MKETTNHKKDLVCIKCKKRFSRYSLEDSILILKFSDREDLKEKAREKLICIDGKNHNLYPLRWCFMSEEIQDILKKGKITYPKEFKKIADYINNYLGYELLAPYDINLNKDILEINVDELEADDFDRLRNMLDKEGFKLNGIYGKTEYIKLIFAKRWLNEGISNM